jgi:hypothetical protein
VDGALGGMEQDAPAIKIHYDHFRKPCCTLKVVGAEVCTYLIDSEQALGISSLS